MTQAGCSGGCNSDLTPAGAGAGVGAGAGRLNLLAVSPMLGGSDRAPLGERGDAEPTRFDACLLRGWVRH